MTNKKAITQLEALKAESEYMRERDPENEVWMDDIVAINRAIRAIKRKNRSAREWAQLFIFITSVAAFFLLYIKVDSLYKGQIDHGQALTLSIPVLVYMIIAVNTYKRLGKED